MSENIQNTVTVKDQLKKFALKSLYGFQTVIVYGLGTRLGLFDYLYQKGKETEADKVSSVSFTIQELSENLKINIEYLDALIHMAFECGLFEIDESCELCLKTASHVYDILVDKDNLFYIGGTLNCFYMMAPYQDRIFENFKKGTRVNILQEVPGSDNQMAQSICGVASNRVAEMYESYFKEHRRHFRKTGSLLEVGCGYGYNLAIWAKKYKKVRIVGIDIDPQGVEFTKDLVSKNNWDDHVEVIKIEISEYAKSHRNEFDIIIMNHVLHEMTPDDAYRKKCFADLYSMLKSDGLLIVVEHNIPSIFAPKDRLLFFEIWHKLFEVYLNTKFYSEDEFRKFVADTPFKEAKLIKERNDYFWALTK